MILKRQIQEGSNDAFSDGLEVCDKMTPEEVVEAYGYLQEVEEKYNYSLIMNWRFNDTDWSGEGMKIYKNP